MIESRVDVYKKNKQLREAGKFLAYPIFEMNKKLGEVIPALFKGMGIMITAHSGVCKTQFWKRIFFWNIIRFHIEKCESFKPYFLLFLLEEKKEEFIDTLYSMLIYEKYRKVVDYNTLNSYSKEILSDDLLEIIETCSADVDKILSYCLINDSVYNPFGLYKICREVSNEKGTHYYTTLIESNTIITAKEYYELPEEIRVEYKYSHYKAFDENEQVFVITDHLALLQPENGMDLRATMEHWVGHYGLKHIQKHFQWSNIDIVQQVSAGEEAQYTNRGDSIIDKVKPSLSGLGDNKAIQRHYKLIIGLFSPARHNVDKYANYKVVINGGLFEKLITAIVIKARKSKGYTEIPFLFDGACNYFKELPRQLTDEMYKMISESKYGNYDYLPETEK